MSLFKKTDDTAGESCREGAEDGGQENGRAAAGLREGAVEKNVGKFRRIFGDSSDFIVNYIRGGDGRLCCANIYFLGLSDGNTINFISSEAGRMLREEKCPDFKKLIKGISGLRPSKEDIDIDTACEELLLGNTVFISDDAECYCSIATNSNDGRAITEPTSQTIIKGPKDAFTENINKNVYLIRRRIRNAALRVENLTVGSITRTNVRLMYISGIAKENILGEIRARLQKINIDCLLDSNYIEELIKENKYSLFPTVLNSEKPDSVSAALLEGRIAILVDGCPYIITVPALMVEFLQASEDYYHNFIMSSFIRILRYSSVLLTLLVPAFFVTITTFHQEIIPATLLVSIAAQREGIPFPAFLEVLLLEFTFEILREAGIRMPRAVGSAISIVGALVLGQAAVEAGLISAAVVIVVSITAIASFVITNYSMSNSIRLLRFAFIILAGILGLYGITMGLIVLCLHLCSLKSVTIPYLMPYAPSSREGKKDAFARFPLWKMTSRPEGLSDSKEPRTSGSAASEPSVLERPEFQ